MSGIKEIMVTMTQTERNRLVNNARSATETAEQHRQRQLATQNALNTANRKIETLNLTLNNEISGLHTEIRQMTNEQNRRLREQAANFNGAISDLKTQMERNNQSLQNAINNVQANIQAKENTHRGQAEIWINQTKTFFTDIEQYRHDLFAPSRLEKLKNELNQTSSNMRSEAFQAAIATAMSVFNKAAELKEIVVNAEIEWNFYYKKLQEALADTRSNLDYRKTMQFTFATEDGDEIVDAKINYWTGNALDDIEKDLARIEQRAGQSDKLSTDELKEMTSALNEINARGEFAENQAKEALILSAYRAEMADKLAEVLDKQGWQCKDEDMTYEGNEHNKPVHVKFTDISGSGNEIVAVITPVENAKNNLELNFFTRDNDEEFRQTMSKSIHTSLQENGLNVGEPVCREGYKNRSSDNERVRDIKATAARGLKTAKV